MAIRITIVSGIATTAGNVINHLTLGIGGTGSWTGIAAVLIQTSQMARTVRVDHAFGSTSFVGVAVIFR